MSKSVRSGLVCIAFVGAMLGASVPAEVQAAPPPAVGSAVQVDKVSFPVRLSDGHDYQITGYYHHRGAPSERVLQVLVHGATHYHLYWDLPEINGISYSYASYMAEHDYDVLIAAENAELDDAAAELRAMGGAQVDAVRVDLATREGVETLIVSQ